MLDFSLIKKSLKLINKHVRHISYLQFTINIFQIYFSVSVNEVIFYNDLWNFCKKIFVKSAHEHAPTMHLRHQ